MLWRALTKTHSDIKRSNVNFCLYCGVRLCHFCRKERRKDNQFELCGDASTWDHVTPGLNGRGVTGRHKVVSCMWCNGDRGDKTYLGWRNSLSKRFITGQVTNVVKARAVLAGGTLDNH